MRTQAEAVVEGQADSTLGQAAPEWLGRYPLLSVVGTGSMGMVYKSLDPQTSRAIAIKTIRSELLDDDMENYPARLRIEAQAAGALTHPGIVRVYEYGEAKGYAYIAMEYVEGHSLRDCFERKVRFNTDQAVNILAQLLKALQYAHERGVWHRDIKPANILLLRDGEVKVTDFGIARVESLNLTQADPIMGTPGFIAPEMYLGEAFDHRIDLFAAGVVFYHLLAGEPPFVGTPEKIMFKVCYESPLPVSVVARQPSLRIFDAVVLKALARRPEDRFGSAAEFLEALVLAQAGGLATGDQTVIVSRRSADRQGSGDETLLTARSSTGADETLRPSAGADDTLLMSRRSVGADETLLMPRPSAGSDESLRPSAGGDETLLVSRRTAGADETLLMSRPSNGGDERQLVPRSPDDGDQTLLVSRARAEETRLYLQRSPSSEASLTTSRPPERAPSCNAQQLTLIERQLAHFVGPIARVLVRSAASEASDTPSLIQALAAKIERSPDREAFLRSAGFASVTRGRSVSDAESDRVSTGGGAKLTPEYIARAAQLLAVHMGPIAKVLAKRAAQPGFSQEQFVAALAAHLTDDGERARFLRALA